MYPSQTYLKAAAGLKWYVGRSQLPDSDGRWEGRINNYTFISECASYSLGEQCAGERLPYAWGHHQLVPQD